MWPVQGKEQWKINKERLIQWLPMGYYYFFYGALGSLFPYLNLYYRAIGLDPWQIGIVGGIRPLVALVCGPLWSCMTNRYKIRKRILVASLLSWIVFTLPIAFVQHAREGRCDETRKTPPFANDSLAVHDLAQDLGKDARSLTRKLFEDRSAPMETRARVETVELGRSALIVKRSILSKKRIAPFIDLKKPFVNSFRLSGMQLEEVDQRKPQRKPYDFKSRGLPYANKRKNPFAGTVFGEVFFLVLFGEMLQSPTDDLNTHYDGTFLENLGVLFQNLNKNSLYSSLGIGVIASFTGLLLHYAPKIEICDEIYSDYRIAFYIFTVFMAVAAVIAMKFDFIYRRRRRSFDTKESLEVLISFRHVGFFLIVLLMGIFRGVLFNFLYWNLCDIGGSDVVVGVTVVSQYLSDALMYKAAPLLVPYIGYLGMIFCGLASYALRFLIYSWISSPTSAWVAVPVELLQGISHATAWSAFLLYITNYTPKSTFATGVFLLQGIYLGVGGSLGAIIGGILIQSFDTNVAFRLFALLSIFSCLVFLMIQPGSGLGGSEIPSSQVDTISYFTDDEEYSSFSEDELYEYNGDRAIIYLPSKGDKESLIQTKKTVLPSTNSPFVPTIMSLVKKEDY